MWSNLLFATFGDQIANQISVVEEERNLGLLQPFVLRPIIGIPDPSNFRSVLLGMVCAYGIKYVITAIAIECWGKNKYWFVVWNVPRRYERHKLISQKMYPVLAQETMHNFVSNRYATPWRCASYRPWTKKNWIFVYHSRLRITSLPSRHRCSTFGFWQKNKPAHTRPTSVASLSNIFPNHRKFFSWSQFATPEEFS